MEFGLWWVATLNFPFPASVKSKLHRDWKNVAGGVCAIFAFGKRSQKPCFRSLTLKLHSGDFDDDEESWIILWELNMIFQIRRGCWMFIPSAILTHGNFDYQGKISPPTFSKGC